MNFIQETCTQIVNPPKLKYSMMDLGYAISNYGRRYDFNVTNNDHQNLKCSLYVPKIQHASKICVIYLHSMNGSRLQCLSYVDVVLKRGLFLCSFDFSGCGNSQGISISFGANQKYDVGAVIQQLVSKYRINRFILWGRSMGAVAILKYCQMMMTNYSLIQIHGILLDSPFESLKKLIIQLGVKRSDLPKLFIHAFYLLIQGTLEKKGKFDVQDLQLLKSIKTIQGIPICFLVSKQDTTIDASHSQALYNAYNYWDKKLQYFTGLHNQSRDEQYLFGVLSFIQDKINRISQRQQGLRYKRIILQKSALLNNTDQQTQINGNCQCNIFTNRL